MNPTRTSPTDTVPLPETKPSGTNSSGSNAGDEYRFQIELYNERGDHLCDTPLLRKDFEHAVLATWFEGFRSGHLHTYSPALESALIQPRFATRSADASTEESPARGKARIETFEIEVDSGAYRHEFATSYFRRPAARAQRRYLAGLPTDNSHRVEADTPATSAGSEHAENGQVFFQVSAYWDDHAANQNPATTGNVPRITLGPSTVRLPVKPVSRSSLGSAETWDGPSPKAIDVLVERSVLEDVLTETDAAPEREICGFLLGHFAQDPQTHEYFLWVTGFASGSDTTLGDSTSVTFTPDTFALGRRMIELRGEGEMILGWYHSHPFRFCAECPLPTPPECIQKVLFYSEDDLQLMESTFEQPFLIGLLTAVEPKLNDAIGHPPVRLYGWINGKIEQRAMQVVESDA